METNLKIRFWVELQNTVDNMNNFTKSKDYKLVADILKKYNIEAVIRSEVKN